MQSTKTTEQSTIHDNPAGLDGFEFLEFSAPDPKILDKNFLQMGFTPIAKHRSKDVTLYRQGKINFILNNEPNSQAAEHAKLHGPGACAMGFKVKDAQQAYKYTLSHGAKEFHARIGQGEAVIPAIHAIGGSVIYFIDHQNKQSIYDQDFIPLSDKTSDVKGCGLDFIDHLTHNVQRGHMDKWAKFYKELFNFFEIRYFDIKGEKTGLVSYALSSPCGRIKIPLNESSDDKSQIAEFLEQYNGEGIQHIALSTDNIYDTVEQLRSQGVNFLYTPDTYYELLPNRVSWHHEDIERMKRNKILLDGGKTEEGGLLLQIFTENVFGPEFFEIIQRKHNEGFGEGNFQALFEAIERDQIQRGVL